MSSCITSPSLCRNSLDDFVSHKPLPRISSLPENLAITKPKIIYIPAPNGFRVKAERYDLWIIRTLMIEILDKIKTPEPDWIEYRGRLEKPSVDYAVLDTVSEDYYSQAGFVLKKIDGKRIWTFPDPKPQEKEISEKPQIQSQTNSKPDENSQTKPFDFVSACLESIKLSKFEKKFEKSTKNQLI